MARIKRERFSPVDTTWFRMDRLSSKMMITGVMMFEKPLDAPRVKELLSTRMLIHERFRQRVRETPLGITLPHWEDDPHFDIDAHIHRIALPAPGGVAELQALASDLMSTSLDYDRPLWQVHLVENFGDGCALIVRLHHCIADGLALVEVLLSMADSRPDGEPTVQPEPRTRELLRQTTPAPRGPGASGVQAIAGAVLQEGRRTVRRPRHALELVGQGGEVVAAAAKLVLTLPDRKTMLRQSCGVLKRAAWSEPFPLDEVKAIGKRLDATVNDVLVTAVSGALRRYLEGNGQPAEGVEIRAMVPVNLRQPNETGKLGNRFGLIILALPVGTRDPVERMVIMKKRMNDIKHSPEALVAFVLLNGIGLMPKRAEQLAGDFFAAKTSTVLTNVPGPREPLYLAGSRLDNMMFWVPVSSSLGMGISILSYAGKVTVGIMTDACMAPDPITIAENYNLELREMQARFLPELHPFALEEAAAAGSSSTAAAAMLPAAGVSPGVTPDG